VVSDTLAAKAIGLLMDALPKCVQNNMDVEAREKAQMASLKQPLAIWVT
jgi:alcohol dehydrogenase class IV